MYKKIKNLIPILLVILLTIGSFTSFAETLNNQNAIQNEILKDKISLQINERFESGEKIVPVMVKLKEQADIEEVSKNTIYSLNARNLDKNEIELATREAVIESLENTANKTQKNLLAYLRLEEGKGNVEEYKSFYIANMVYVKATKAVIERIALMDEVEHVYYDEKVYLFDVVINEEEIEKAIEESEEFGSIELIDIEEDTEDGGKIEIIEDDSIIDAQAVSPSDIEWNIKQINADDVWNTYGIDGSGVVVATIDSGVVWDHPALKNKYRGYNAATGTVDHSASWYDAYAGRTTPYDDSSSPHGTHVMGTILGQEASGRNAIGVAPGAKFIAAKGLGPYGGSSSDLIDAGQWMLRPGGSAANAPDVINNSWGGGAEMNDWYRDVVRAWRAAGIVPVFAAGNHRSSGEPPAGSIACPANYPESFAVAATDSNNRRATFSLKGPSPYDRSLIKPDISAPGVNIRSSVPNGYQGGWNGTSMAAPHIAGVVALIVQANPNLSVSQIEAIIKETATPLTDNSYPSSPNMGYGYGLVNALSAVEAAGAGEIPDPVQTGSMTGRITDYDTGYGISGARVSISGTSLYGITDNSGYYTINNIPVGTQQITVTADGYQAVSGSVTIEANRTVTVNGTMKRENVVQTGTVTGRVVDYYSGSGISYARVSVGDKTTYTDSYGYYTLNNVPAGSQYMTVGASGYYSASGYIDVIAGGTITVNARLVRTWYFKNDDNDIEESIVPEEPVEPTIPVEPIEVPLPEQPEEKIES
ncbi:bacillopeptidase F [Proteiniborus sp. DW1]|uniref:S8 family serine peptidase n=1 Tax=Proteiniborus sp. DW1 TaxID=1889883 RepID=UPI00092DF0E4|nr:S8 family serine peptidase [Proteiniborus sp. DW1]SCG84500.1 bacillopeptidase F [Proteiniborus sp. DW1]